MKSKTFFPLAVLLAVTLCFPVLSFAQARKAGTSVSQSEKLVAFHLDMRMPHYRADYLKRWIGELKRMGYNAIVWEMSDGVAWDTARAVNKPSSLSDAEFRSVLDECRRHGIRLIPLLQVLGHADYVLKEREYFHLRDNPDSYYQYCPLSPDVLSFLDKWIDEHLRLFGDIEYFHLGGDEARLPFSCATAKAFLHDRPVGELYARHVNIVAGKLIKRGITPIIWADMAMAHQEAFETLSRKIMLIDWKYDLWRETRRVFIWGKGGGMKMKDQLTAEDISRYGEFLFPHGDGPDVQPETFYVADFIAAKGFPVITASAAKNSGDNVFSPRSEMHLKNTFDYFHKGMSPHLLGSMQVGWSHHMHPWELELAFLELPGFIYANPKASLADFRRAFVRKTFGTDDGPFWQASESLSKSCLFTASLTLGWGMDVEPVPADHVQRTLARVREQGKVREELNSCRQRQLEYQEGLRLFGELATRSTRGGEYLRLWNLAARNLINRARASGLLLAREAGELTSEAVGAEAAQLLREMRGLRIETAAMYESMIRSPRRQQMVTYIYDAVEKAIAELAGQR